MQGAAKQVAPSSRENYATFWHIVLEVRIRVYGRRGRLEYSTVFSGIQWQAYNKRYDTQILCPSRIRPICKLQFNKGTATLHLMRSC